jgi:hypothetical protein
MFITPPVAICLITIDVIDIMGQVEICCTIEGCENVRGEAWQATGCASRDAGAPDVIAGSVSDETILAVVQ